MNQASCTVAGPRPSPDTASVPSGATVARKGEGRGKRASARANRGASAEGAGSPRGNSSRNVPSSGTQMRSHTSQDAVARTTNGSGSGPGPGTTSTGNSTSPV